MLKQLDLNIPIEPIIEQVMGMDLSKKRIELNKPSGKYFNDPWINLIPNTPLGDVLDKLGDIGQARLLCLESGETYTAHTDPDDRYHLAITTNDYSYLVDISKEKFYHVPVDGVVWYMDTSTTHIAVNWGPTTRIHLNVRVLLPHYSSERPGIKFTVNDSKTEWKQDSYIEIMGFINRSVKSGVVTGFEAPNATTLFVNCSEPHVFDTIINNIKQRGVDIEVTVL